MRKSERKADEPRFAPITSENQSDWEVVPADERAIAAPRLGAMISVRLEPDLASSVRRAAGIEGVSQSEFIRKAVEERVAAILSKAEISLASPPGEESVPVVWKQAGAGLISEEHEVPGAGVAMNVAEIGVR